MSVCPGLWIAKAFGRTPPDRAGAVNTGSSAGRGQRSLFKLAPDCGLSGGDPSFGWWTGSRFVIASEAKQSIAVHRAGLLRRFAPRNDDRLPMDPLLKIVIVDENPVRAGILTEGLREAGMSQITYLAATTNLLARIYEIDPDVILIDLENPSRDMLEQMFQVSRIVKRPIAMFVDQSDTASIQASVDAGVSAYIVDGLKKERMKHILDLCISRFNAFANLETELHRARSALEDRKVIDRAKGILMKAKGLSEEQAYVLLRTAAMNEKKKIAEIAQSVVTASEMLK